MGYWVWGVTLFLLHTIAGILKFYGVSGVMGFQGYGLGGVRLYQLEVARKLLYLVHMM